MQICPFKRQSAISIDYANIELPRASNNFYFRAPSRVYSKNLARITDANCKVPSEMRIFELKKIVNI